MWCDIFPNCKINLKPGLFMLSLLLLKVECWFLNVLENTTHFWKPWVCNLPFKHIVWPIGVQHKWPEKLFIYLISELLNWGPHSSSWPMSHPKSKFPEFISSFHCLTTKIVRKNLLSIVSKQSFWCLISVILVLPSGETPLTHTFLLQNTLRFFKAANIIPSSSVSNSTITDPSITSVSWFQNFSL